MSNIPSYNFDSLIDPEKSQAFLKDMWNPAYGQGQYFSALHELDEHMLVPIGIDGKWIYILHALHDGFSILKYLNESDVSFKLCYNLETPFTPPSFLKWPIALKCSLSSRPIEKHQFISQLPYEKKLNQNIHFFRIEFSVEETKKFKNINLTSFFLEKLSKFFMKKLSTNQVSRWMIPVNIRGPFKEAALSSMSASYIGVNCSMNDSILDIKNKLIKKLKNGEHWGYWLMGEIGLLGGKKIIMNGTIKSLSETKSKWFALLSNLGDIGGDESSPELIILSPARWHRPIGCVVYIYRNKLNLNVIFHPSLGLSEEVMEQYKNEIYQSIISK